MTTLKICGDVSSPHFDARMWFDINGNNYKFGQFDSADICLKVINEGTTNFTSTCSVPVKRKLMLDVCHNIENQIEQRISVLDDADNILITNAWHPEINHKRLIFNDFLFNRTKAYYSQYAFRPDTQLWYHYDNTAYQVPRLSTADNKTKIFVCPSKTYQGRRQRRAQLVAKMQQYQSLGYLGNYDDNADLFLYSHLEFPYPDFGIEQLREQTRPMSYNHWGYSPPHNGYYADSFISIYGETIEHGSTIAITEKTWDPLIKGHFILPFSCPYFIQRLRDLGVKLPDFVDYSYDNELDNDRRWAIYSNEIDRLLSLDLATWQQHWTDNIDLLYANQKYFHDRNYDRVDLEQLLE